MRWVVPLSLILASLVTISHASCAEVRVGADCTMQWKAPTTNATGTPLTDLKEYRVYVRPFATGVYPTQPAGPAILAPTTQTTCRALGVTTDGRYAAVVKAVDTGGVQSVASNEVVFVRDTQGPGAPEALEIVLQFQGTVTLSPVPTVSTSAPKKSPKRPPK